MADTSTVPVEGSVSWAAQVAEQLLVATPSRWCHTQEVARHARWASVGLRRSDRRRLVAAALLHDIGYAEPLAHTGFHPLDGARHLADLGQHELACLVAHHSGASEEATRRGLADELSEFAAQPGPVADALDYADATSGPKGQNVDPAHRFEEIVDRHGPESVVATSRAVTRVQTSQAVVRTVRRVGDATPVDGLTARPIDLGFAFWIGYRGRLERSTAKTGHRMLAIALKNTSTAVICDLSGLEAIDRAGVDALATASSMPGSAIVFVDPSPAVRHTLELNWPASPKDLHITGVDAALVGLCPSPDEKIQHRHDSEFAPH